MRDAGWGGGAALQGDPGGQQPSITCRVCGMRSFHPDDIREGFCGRCHQWTAVMTDRELAAAIRKLHQQYRPVFTDEYDVCTYCTSRQLYPDHTPWPCEFIVFTEGL